MTMTLSGRPDIRKVTECVMEKSGYLYITESKHLHQRTKKQKSISRFQNDQTLKESNWKQEMCLVWIHVKVFKVSCSGYHSHSILIFKIISTHRTEKILDMTPNLIYITNNTFYFWLQHFSVEVRRNMSSACMVMD